MLLIRQKQAIDLKYTLYLFKDAILPKFISQHIVGSAQPHITVKDLKAYSTYIPVDVTEQKKIGYFFSLLNSKIQKQQEKVELLKQQKTGLMQKIFTRNLRFKDENGQDYPEWDLSELRDIGQVITGNTPSKAINGYYGEEYSWASPADMKGQKYIEETENKLSVIGYQKTRKIPSHSIMMTCIGSTIGKIAMSKNEMSTNQQINTLVPENQNYNDFLYYVIQWEVPRIKSLISSQAVPIINKDTFMRIVIPIAPEEEAIKIGQILSALDHKIQKNIENHSILVKQKKGFMQQMFI
jgi:type I restriction enzyme S subunit